MKYGFCTVFATPLKNSIDTGLLERISRAGFDEVELPLYLVTGLNETAFSELLDTLQRLQLGSSVCTNLFPDDMILTGPGADKSRIYDYLNAALQRAARLKTLKLVFASVPAWQVPAGGTRRQGFDCIASLIDETLLPLCRRYDMILIIEPLRRTVCNLVNTLSDGMELVHRFDSPSLHLMADSYHMMQNEEDPADIETCIDYLEHVHIVEAGRALPVTGFSPALDAILRQLKSSGYDGSISFEPVEGQDEMKMTAALALLKRHFE